jgi:hypothetical protein
LDRGAGQKAPSARPECEQRRHYCQGSKPDHFCGPSQGKHPEAAIEKDCDASQNDLIRMIAGASFLHALCGPALARHGVPSITVLVLGPTANGYCTTGAAAGSSSRRTRKDGRAPRRSRCSRRPDPQRRLSHTTGRSCNFWYPPALAGRSEPRGLAGHRRWQLDHASAWWPMKV